MAARHKTDRIDLLRKQYLSGEAFVQKFPAAVQPYLLLSRYDKPIGYQLLFFPGAISILAGTPYACTPDLSLMAIFAAGTLLTRGAGCTINDIWDRKLDAEVERCKSRPLPAGLVTVDQAKVWFVVQMTAAFGLLTCLNWNTFMLGLVAPIPIMLYPLAKVSTKATILSAKYTLFRELIYLKNGNKILFYHFCCALKWLLV